MIRAKRWTVGAASCWALAAAGCNWLLPFVFIGEHKRTIPAEFDRLEGKRLAVLVWAEPETLFDYPYVRLEVGAYTGDKIRANVKNCDVVDQTQIEEFLERNLASAVDPAKVGEQFEADMVLYIELLRFQMRDAEAPDLLRAHVDGSVTVYDLRSDPDEISRFPLNPVQVVYPEHQPMLMSSQAAQMVRRATYEQFSERVACKFYEHQVDL